MTTYAEARTMESPRTAFVLTMLLVFLSGAAAGALAMNFGLHKGLHRTAFWTDPGKDLSIRRLQRELDLTPAQTEQLKTILDDFAHYYRDVLNTGKGSIYKILNEEQKRKFDRLLNEPEAR
jgi:Spy/CpxP family protein refolding chaperone